MEEKMLHNAIQDVNEAIITDRIEVSVDELNEAVKVAPSPIDLLGTWVNVDSNTRNIVKIIIGWNGGVTIHAFGACTPKPCDWKRVRAMAYGNNVSSNRAVAFSALYHFNFKETIVTGVLQRGTLIVQSFSHFTDGSGRYDYFSIDSFRR
jgi:hypothetical protein